jgi:hypothetical protein
MNEVIGFRQAVKARMPVSSFGYVFGYEEWGLGKGKGLKYPVRFRGPTLTLDPALAVP